MTVKERYQQRLDQAYQSAPFVLLGIIDTKNPEHSDILHICGVCSNKRIRYLCRCRDKKGMIWYIGRDCWTELYNRQFQEQ